MTTKIVKKISAPDFHYSEYVDDILNQLEETQITEQVNEFFEYWIDVCSDPTFFPLHQSKIELTKTPVSLSKKFRRFSRAQILTAAFRMAQRSEGAIAECGVFRGFSAHLMFEVQSSLDPSYTGQDMFLIDSFEGLSGGSDKDFRHLVFDEQGNAYSQNREFAGLLRADLDIVSELVQSLGQVNLVKGWIPDVFAELPDQNYKFVHIDVDLYDPTFASLEYFVPRMVPGGIILNDDYYSSKFPGGGRAWFEYCRDQKLEYLPMDSGQSLLFF